jgi:hypothetical protein
VYNAGCEKNILFILNLIHVKLNKIIETLAKIILIIALIVINLQLLKSMMAWLLMKCIIKRGLE